MKLNINSILMSVALATAPVSVAVAHDGDSSADIPAGYTSQVAASHGVIVKVATDAQGNEMTNSAEIRIVNTPDQPTSGEQANQIWERNSVVSPTANDSSTSGDSSTSAGWRYPGWNSWGYYGWQPAGYYYSYYTPQWNWGGYYYNYYRPNYYYNPYYNGYRYYYYFRRW